MNHFVVVALVAAICLGCNDIRRRKEDVLREDLYSLRSAIDQFTEDRKRPPEGLDDLVLHEYLKSIPKDPFTNSEKTWQLIYEDLKNSPEDIPAAPPREIPNRRGIIDVHSGSDQVGTNGTRYRDW